MRFENKIFESRGKNLSVKKIELFECEKFENKYQESIQVN